MIDLINKITQNTNKYVLVAVLSFILCSFIGLLWFYLSAFMLTYVIAKILLSFNTSNMGEYIVLCGYLIFLDAIASYDSFYPYYIYLFIKVLSILVAITSIHGKTYRTQIISYINHLISLKYVKMILSYIVNGVESVNDCVFDITHNTSNIKKLINEDSMTVEQMLKQMNNNDNKELKQIDIKDDNNIKTSSINIDGYIDDVISSDDSLDE